MSEFLSWGRYPRQIQTPFFVNWPDDVARAFAYLTNHDVKDALAYGCGRSYGDSCLAVSDKILVTRGMDRILAVDWESGVILAQSGLTLAALIRIALPHGWFLPVTPGTKYVTLGGAVANDVHGKNHHIMGTFGRHVRRLVVYRTDEGVVECSSSLRPDLFGATISGLGLTGVILAVELQLRHVSSSEIEQRSIRFSGLNDFFDLSKQYDSAHEYTVAWIDCLARGKQTGRGHYITGDHAKDGSLASPSSVKLSMPIDPPFSLVNSVSLRAFNSLYYYRQRKREVAKRVGYDTFFYPLDRLLEWNKMYGRNGFQQYQCVVPHHESREVIRAVIGEVAKSNTGSFLAVLKNCGELSSPGLLSFPMHGVSLALDFPQRSQIIDRLFAKLDALIHEADGRLYPAKDAHMSALHFKRAYPHWEAIEAMRDVHLLSKFWKRVTQ